MRRRRFLALATAISLIAIGWVVLYVALAGVIIEIRNDTGADIDNVRVAFSQGSVSMRRVTAGSATRQSVGKIGTGADFFLSLERGGERFSAELNAYFMYSRGFDPRTVVTFALSKDGQVQLFSNGKPIDVTQNGRVVSQAQLLRK